jgi:hypothetical protein
LELFRRQLTSPPTPPQPVLLRRTPSGASGAAAAELPTSLTDIGVEVAGIRLSWQDAHAYCAVEQFAAVAKTLCGFPSFFAAPLLRRIRHQYGAKVAVGFGIDDVVADPEWRRLSAAEEASQAAAMGGTGGKASARRAEESKHSGSTAAIDLVVRRTISVDLSAERAPAPEDLADRDVSGQISLPAFLTYWRAEMEPFDACDRFLRLVSKRSGGVNSSNAGGSSGGRFIEAPDFMPFMEEVRAYVRAVCQWLLRGGFKSPRVPVLDSCCSCSPFILAWLSLSRRPSFRRSMLAQSLHASSTSSTRPLAAPLMDVS